MTLLLSDLKQGEKAKIKDFSTVSTLVKRRLIDMGISEGSEICLKCNMPFGGPCMIETLGQCVGLRRNEAATIRVEKR
ncbi:FeoA family protein [Calidifontibacillus oryziterrae]|uniref:FeoA family protein n=1 Tax=Calidifontibacillus oryziterrae TaxID=1191699 RepID=UPI0005595691|nr:FeoA family protein [Calidifontibacillus oryziterrae]